MHSLGYRVFRARIKLRKIILCDCDPFDAVQILRSLRDVQLSAVNKHIFIKYVLNNARTSF